MFCRWKRTRAATTISWLIFSRAPTVLHSSRLRISRLSANCRRSCSKTKNEIGVSKVLPKPGLPTSLRISSRALLSLSTGFFKSSTNAILLGFSKRRSSFSNAGSKRLRSSLLRVSTLASRSPSTQSRCVATMRRRKGSWRDFLPCKMEASFRMMSLPVNLDGILRL